MKLNWGHGITIAIVIMILGILTLVYKSVNSKVELVSEDYYPKGLTHQDEIDKKRNTTALSGDVSIDITNNILVTLPSDFEDPSKIKGEVWFYRASSMKDDFRDSIRLSSSLTLKYPLEKFSEGKYDVIIDWTYNNKPYYYKESILIDQND